MNSAVTATTTCARCAATLSPELPGTLCPECFGANLFSDTLTDPDAAEAAQAGLRRIGDYELGAELGRGGMGVVYRARQISLNRPAAVKLILTGPLASAVERQRFLAEAEAAAALDHPGIVAIYEAGEDGGQPFFAMQLVEGESLSARMRQAKAPLPPRDAALLALRVAQAVQHAHERGFLHRDLKPANILLSSDGTPHVTDFGLARRVDSDAHLTLTGAAIGTPSYMAPEQTDTRQPPTTAVDVYSLGAILYEMLSGHPPFRADSLAELFTAIREKEAASISSVRSEVDRDLDIICRKCLEKEPARRYRSAQSFADDLQHWLNGEPIAARAAGRTERLWRWCRRRPALAALAAACMLLLLTVAIGSTITVVKIAGLRAREHEALLTSQKNLRASLLSEAKAGRGSGQDGLRARGLPALRHAAIINQGSDVRDELIAHLGLFDLQPLTDGSGWQWPEGAGHYPVGASATFDISAVGFPVPDSKILFFSGPPFGADTVVAKVGGRRIEGIHFRPDGKLAAIQVTGPQTVLLDCATREFRATFDDVWMNAWSPDGAVFAVMARGNRYDLHDGNTLTKIGSIPGTKAGPLSFSPVPGSSVVLVPGDDGMIVWDWRDARELSRYAKGSRVTSTAWGTDFVAAGCEDGRVLWWNLDTGNSGGTTHRSLVSGLKAVPGSSFLFTYSYDATSLLCDTRANAVLTRSRDLIPRLLHRNGRDFLFSNKEMGGRGQIVVPESCRLLNLAGGDNGKSIRPDFSPDGRWLVMMRGGAMMLNLYEPAAGRSFLVPLPVVANSAHFLADSRHILLAGNDSAWLLDLQPGPDGVQPQPPVLLGKLPKTEYDHAHLNQARQRVVMGSDNNGILFGDLAASVDSWERLKPPSNPGANRTGCSISPDGAWVAMGSFHGEGLRMHNIATNTPGPLLQAGAGHAAFSPDGTRLLYTSQPVLRLFETGSWRPCGEIRSGIQSDQPGRACWHPDSRHLAIVKDNSTVEIWETRSLILKATLTPHTPVELDYVAFSPDGRFLAVATKLARVLFWDLGRLAGEMQDAGETLDLPVVPLSVGIPAPEFPERRPWRPRPADTAPEHLALDACFSHMLELQTIDGGPGATVNIKPGILTVEGTRFDVRGLSRLAHAGSWKRYPSRFPAISVGRRCRYLHFLQSTVGSDRQGEASAVVQVQYEGGEAVSVPLRFGEETGDWSQPDRKPPQTSGAWTGNNNRGDHPVLWKYTWTNPHPERTVVSLSVEAAMRDASLMLAGITVE